MRRILTVISDLALASTTVLCAHEIHDFPLVLKCVWCMALFSAALRNMDN